MISQTIRPHKWIIVNDGSTDKTSEIIQEYSNEHRWIQIINRPIGRFRELGRSVVESFYEGYKRVKSLDFDFIVKLIKTYRRMYHEIPKFWTDREKAFRWVIKGKI